MFKRNLRAVVRLLLVCLLAPGIYVAFRFNLGCWRLWSTGLKLQQCPDGDITAATDVHATGLQRGVAGKVTVDGLAQFVVGSEHQSRTIAKARATLALVDHAGDETPLAAANEFHLEGDHLIASVKLPEVADGDYVLRARTLTVFGESHADLPLAFYSPAHIQVETDRVLYEPGQPMHFEARVVRPPDDAPIENRSGKWAVTDAQGGVVFNESTPAGPWGVATGTFALAATAPAGDWKVRWSSGDDAGEATVRVRPRPQRHLRVEAVAGKTFYQAGERPLVKGVVLYPSGAPAQAVHLHVTWTHHGDWPVPPEWDEDGLPTSATGGPTGAFKLTLPVVPRDLRGRNTLFALITATDGGGREGEAQATVVLSEDSLQVVAVPEFASGLVEGIPNRLYLRVTDAAGKPVPGAELTLRRPWDPKDPGVHAVTDEDSVAEIQFDPGPAFKTTIPPMPVRGAAGKPGVTRVAIADLLTGGDAPTASPVVLALDALEQRLQACARFARAPAEGMVVDLRVSELGRVKAVPESDELAASCLARTMAEVRLPLHAGLYAATFDVNPPAIPDLKATIAGASGAFEDATAAFNAWALDARSCLPRDVESGPFPEQMIWSVDQDSQDMDQTWQKRPDGVKLPASVIACVHNRFADMDLEEPAAKAGLGVLRLDITAPARAAPAAPPLPPVTMMGYELAVSARTARHELGAAKLRIAAGHAPTVRLHATPAVAKAGGTVDVEVIRGPAFDGKLPERLLLERARAWVETAVDGSTHTARFRLPSDAEGWFIVGWGGAETRVFVKS